MISKLNQIIAVEKGLKTRAEKDLTEAHHSLKKHDLLSGMSRIYKPASDDGEQLPPEVKRVQLVAEDVVQQTAKILTELFDITATKDFANSTAKADVLIDSHVLIKDAPVSYLLWLEKKLTDVHTFVKELPKLSDSEAWHLDEHTGWWVTDEEQNHRTKKLPIAFEKAKATDKHPAQVEVVFEDKVVGYWHIVKRSGAVPASRVRQLLDRVEKLQRAVKVAREGANMTEAPNVKVGEKLFQYLFAA